jgi:hypothetical protein
VSPLGGYFNRRTSPYPPSFALITNKQPLAINFAFLQTANRHLLRKNWDFPLDSLPDSKKEKKTAVWHSSDTTKKSTLNKHNPSRSPVASFVKNQNHGYSCY